MHSVFGLRLASPDKFMPAKKCPKARLIASSVLIAKSVNEFEGSAEHDWTPKIQAAGTVSS